jgi:hypothetical protein
LCNGIDCQFQVSGFIKHCAWLNESHWAPAFAGATANKTNGAIENTVTYGIFSLQRGRKNAAVFKRKAGKKT